MYIGRIVPNVARIVANEATTLRAYLRSRLFLKTIFQLMKDSALKRIRCRLSKIEGFLISTSSRNTPTLGYKLCIIMFFSIFLGTYLWGLNGDFAETMWKITVMRVMRYFSHFLRLNFHCRVILLA